MKNLWSDIEAAQFKDELALRVYTSRLLGQDSSLVLHGGGNTSVKIIETNLVDIEEDIQGVVLNPSTDKINHLFNSD